ncbi:MAG TPA: ATP-binding protein [Bacteroidales bacterium]|nr:ATP-binding protein [Bacteroidales bacterium]
MRFVDRFEELKRLSAALNSPTPSFVVVYGRRRLGKSTLIKKVLSPADVYYMAGQTERSHQIELLAKEIGLRIEGFDRVVYPHWSALFEALNFRAQERFTLCLDEFPYMAKSSPELPSILQKLIDSKTLRYNIVLCGSSQQLMQGLFLDAASPLYGRADQILKLSPIPLRYLREVLACQAQEAIEEYAVWGGVPRYWEIRLKSGSLNEAIKYNLLNAQGLLFDEPYRLFIDDMRDIVQAATLLAFIGNGVNRPSEIAARTNKPATSLSGPLDNLITLGYIRREIPFGDSLRNSKKGLYKLADPFMEFYFRFVVPNRSLIELGRTEVVMEEVVQRFNAYVSMHWENMCRRAISGQELMGKRYGLASRWWGNILRNQQMEIDVVAESTDGKCLLVGECKWSAGENADKLLKQLLEKANKLPFAANKEIVPVLFLKNHEKAAENILLPERVIEMI